MSRREVSKTDKPNRCWKSQKKPTGQFLEIKCFQTRMEDCLVWWRWSEQLGAHCLGQQYLESIKGWLWQLYVWCPWLNCFRGCLNTRHLLGQEESEVLKLRGLKTFYYTVVLFHYFSHFNQFSFDSETYTFLKCPQ